MVTGILGLFFLGISQATFAHFGMVIPSDSMVMQGDNKHVTVTLSFSHPFEGEEMDGKSIPFAEVEVEYYNEDRKAEAPTDYMVTQTVKADKNGVFIYAVPKAGWWGFAALNTSEKK